MDEFGLSGKTKEEIQFLINKKVEQLSDKKAEKKFSARANEINNKQKELNSLQTELYTKQSELLKKEKEIESQVEQMSRKLKEEIEKQEEDLKKKQHELSHKEKKLDSELEDKLKQKQKDLEIKQKEIEKRAEYNRRQLEAEIKKKEADLDLKRKVAEKQVPKILDKAKADVKKMQQQIQEKQKDLLRKQGELIRRQKDLSLREKRINAGKPIQQESSKSEDVQQSFKSRRVHDDSDSENWLMTYSDVITLLLTMFVFMFSMASFDKTKLEEIKRGIEVSLLKRSGDKLIGPGNTGEAVFGAMKKRMQTIFNENELGNNVEMSTSGTGLKLELSSSALYDLGSANIKENIEPVLDKLVNMFKDIKYNDYIIDVEGHTDNIPINTLQFPSNWELSAARASNIVKYFIEKGIGPKKLRASGFADSRPKVPNVDEEGNPIPENQAANRRVVVYVERTKK